MAKSNQVKKNILEIQEEISRYIYASYRTKDRDGLLVLSAVGKIPEELSKSQLEIGKYRTDNPRMAKELYRKYQTTNIVRAAVFLLAYANAHEVFVAEESAGEWLQACDLVYISDILAGLFECSSRLPCVSDENARTPVQRVYNYLAVLAKKEVDISLGYTLRRWNQFI